jgi:hypothetical protein
MAKVMEARDELKFDGLKVVVAARSDSICGIGRRSLSSRPSQVGTAEAMVEQANGRSRGLHTCLVALKVPREA